MIPFQKMGKPLVSQIKQLSNTARELPSDYKGLPRDTYGREVYYDIPDPSLKQATQWLISNPNRINLGRIGLRYKGASLDKALITAPRQELDVWSGVITSTFVVDGETVRVLTQGDFESDAVVFDVKSRLVESGDLSVELDFPYPPIHTTKYKYEVRLAWLRLTIPKLTFPSRCLPAFTASRLTTQQHWWKMTRIEPLLTSSTCCRKPVTLRTSDGQRTHHCS